MKERAKKFTRKKFPKDLEKFRREISKKTREVYIEVATEQRAYDIDAAVEWLDNVLYEGHINSGMDKKRLLEVFRLDMEEEDVTRVCNSGYRLGAEETHEKDVEKACDTLRGMLPSDWDIAIVEEFVKSFRKEIHEHKS